MSKIEETPPQTKINVTSKSPVGDISVVTLIRTNTTLDHSQKAEKVWSGWGRPLKPNTLQNIRGAFAKAWNATLPAFHKWRIVRLAGKLCQVGAAVLHDNAK